jgi:isoprenylcysteine carboxyl methyltransferase (ICMT) family protein YpbQ
MALLFVEFDILSNQNQWIVRVGVRVANPTQYSLLLLLHCWMLIGCVVLGCVEFRALKKRSWIVCDRLPPSFNKKEIRSPLSRMGSRSSE